MTPLVLMLLVASIAAQRTEVCKMDLAFAIDSSGSIYGDGTGTEENWTQIKNFLVALVRYFEIGPDQALVGAVTFASAAQVEWHLDRYTDSPSLVNRINNLIHPNGGTTSTEQALRLVRNEIFSQEPRGRNRLDAEDIVLVVTDGRPSNYNPVSFGNALADLKRTATVIGVSVGDAIDRDIMALIDRDFISVADFSALDAIAEDIANRVCQIVSPPGPTQPSGDCPAPMQTYAFSAYIEENDDTFFEDDMVLEFTGIYSNLGGAYDRRSVFRCPCDGYYEFTLIMNGIKFGMGAAIFKDRVVVSPMAYVHPTGAMSTTTIIQCMAGQSVWAQVVILHARDPIMPCTLQGMSLMGFSGKLVTTI